MTKRKKITRAYKVGQTDGRNGEHKNPYPEGSQWAFDYERGYDEGLPSLTCYQCDKTTEWLAPDSRCGDCTRLTVDEIRGVTC
jgi:hypothetical protein